MKVRVRVVVRVEFIIRIKVRVRVRLEFIVWI